MSRKQPEPEQPADFDETMRRLMGIPAERAKEIVRKSAPGKPKSVRERKTRRRAR
jgi:hypothetical protein